MFPEVVQVIPRKDTQCMSTLKMEKLYVMI